MKAKVTKIVKLTSDISERFNTSSARTDYILDVTDCSLEEFHVAFVCSSKDFNFHRLINGMANIGGTNLNIVVGTELIIEEDGSLSVIEPLSAADLLFQGQIEASCARAHDEIKQLVAESYKKLGIIRFDRYDYEGII